MLEAHGVILEGREKIGLGQVAGVTGFGEKAQVGQAELYNQLCFLLHGRFVTFRADQRISDQKESEHSDAEKDETDVESRFSHFLLGLYWDTDKRRCSQILLKSYNNNFYLRQSVQICVPHQSSFSITAGFNSLSGR